MKRRTRKNMKRRTMRSRQGRTLRIQSTETRTSTQTADPCLSFFCYFSKTLPEPPDPESEKTPQIRQKQNVKIPKFQESSKVNATSPSKPHPLPHKKNLKFPKVSPKWYLSGTKKEHKHKEFGQNPPLPDPPPPQGTPTPQILYVGASFPFRIQEKGLHKEFCRGGVLGALKFFMLDFFACFLCT